MDLSFSPDVDARVCYLIVLLCALLAAYRQVDRRLATYPGSWTESPTWLLYASYVFVPLGLFWLLDRTGAINDTSVVAAAFVGVGYERILSGQGEPRLPAAVAGFWTPFAAFADSISARVSKRIADRVFRFDRRLMDEVAADRSLFDALRQLARSLTRNLTSLDKKIADIEANRPVLGDRLTQEKQALECYAEVTQAPRWLELLRDGKAISDATYKSYPSDTGVWSRVAEILLPLLFILSFLVSSNLVDREYHLWRLGKANATATDQWRTREALTAYVVDPATTLTMSSRIARLARGPAMQPGRLELALQILIAGAKRAKRVPVVAGEIVGALRAPAADNRTRLHSALLYLAQYQTGTDPCLTTAPATFPKPLCEWKPTDGDSIVDIEERIERWTAFWAAYLPPSPPGDAAPDAKQ
ncbi:MAG TPA: hypothetical protein VLT62_00820 [Candidatus Methylomirabilis sp.]|nr:hypothetical protein [Candidatus Methylomirabilis sp.]